MVLYSLAPPRTILELPKKLRDSSKNPETFAESSTGDNLFGGAGDRFNSRASVLVANKTEPTSVGGGNRRPSGLTLRMFEMITKDTNSSNVDPNTIATPAEVTPGKFWLHYQRIYCKF